MVKMSIEIREANLGVAREAEAFLNVLQSYAQDVMGGGRALAPDVVARLPAALSAHPGALVLLAWAGERAVGVATCLLGFSTFAAQSLLNIHDLAVVPEFRGQGVGRALLGAAEAVARTRGCIKLSLEVLEDNTRAQQLYESFGFRNYEIGGVERRTFFLTKPLSP